MTPQAQPQGQGQAPNDQGVGNSTPGAMQGIAQPQAFTAPGNGLGIPLLPVSDLPSPPPH